MTFKTLSLLVPTRGQVARLSHMWRSYVETVGDGTNIELVFRIDDDDAETAAWMRGTATTVEAYPDRASAFEVMRTQRQALRRTVVSGKQHDGYISLPRFFNEMARHATGDLLMCGNDDMTFLTPEWPALLLQAANRFPDGIFDIGCYTYPASAFPFSVVSRRAVETLGFLNDERLVYSDIFLRDVMARFGRAVIAPEVVILHIGQANHDANAVKWHLHTNAVEYWERHHRAVDEAVARLKAA